jgi:hypothetical protein
MSLTNFAQQMPIKAKILQIKYLVKKLWQFSGEEESTKKFILNELDGLCLDLIKEIQTIENNQDATAENNQDATAENKLLRLQAKDFQKKEHKYKILVNNFQVKIDHLENQLSNRDKSLKLSTNSDEQILREKEKVLAAYQSKANFRDNLTTGSPQTYKKRSQLFDW